MKIKIDENIVEFRPEGEAEKKDLESLWNLLIDCVRYNKKLVPVGEYVPIKDQVAQFSVEEQFTE
jgi:hypothetical protein